MLNIDNCHILIENGRLRIIYDLPGLLFPVTLIDAHSCHELNEKAMKIFEPKVWIRYLIEQAGDKSISPAHPLLADVCKNHKGYYAAVCNDMERQRT